MEWEFQNIQNGPESPWGHGTCVFYYPSNHFTNWLSKNKNELINNTLVCTYKYPQKKNPNTVNDKLPVYCYRTQNWGELCTKDSNWCKLAAPPQLCSLIGPKGASGILGCGFWPSFRRRLCSLQGKARLCNQSTKWWTIEASSYLRIFLWNIQGNRNDSSSTAWTYKEHSLAPFKRMFPLNDRVICFIYKKQTRERKSGCLLLVFCF